MHTKCKTFPGTEWLFLLFVSVFNAGSFVNIKWHAQVACIDQSKFELLHSPSNSASVTADITDINA